MVNQAATGSFLDHRLQSAQVAGVAVLCLLSGVTAGYLLQGLGRTPSSPALSGGGAAAVSAAPAAVPTAVAPVAGAPGQSAAHAAAMPSNHPPMGSRRMPTMEEMKQMADKQAAPLLEKLKGNPKDSATLAQVGGIYHATHQFKEAAGYYRRAVEANPKDTSIRTKYAISLYRDDDVDGALAQLKLVLQQDPKNADALFNLGMIKVQAKQDGKGAIAAWQQLLRSNPDLSADRKAQVQKLMAAVLTNLANQQPVQEASGHEQPK